MGRSGQEQYLEPGEEWAGNRVLTQITTVVRVFAVPILSSSLPPHPLPHSPTQHPSQLLSGVHGDLWNRSGDGERREDEELARIISRMRTLRGLLDSKFAFGEVSRTVEKHKVWGSVQPMVITGPGVFGFGVTLKSTEFLDQLSRATHVSILPS